jgi:hypothetical protein
MNSSAKKLMKIQESPKKMYSNIEKSAEQSQTDDKPKSRNKKSYDTPDFKSFDVTYK